eukprot:5044372-Pyramimonas_sp.AAC.1
MPAQFSRRARNFPWATNRHRGCISCGKPPCRSDFGLLLRQHCFLFCGRAGGNGDAMFESLEL